MTKALEFGNIKETERLKTNKQTNFDSSVIAIVILLKVKINRSSLFFYTLQGGNDMNQFRTLNANEIECRIAQVKSNGLVLLLYKDARVDQNLLDETVGPLNWQREHQLIGDRLYCTVSIWDDEKQQWISKQDVGTESYTEKEKGQASDSFKRACFNFGIGRELYTAPFIWISSDDCTITKDKNGNEKCYDNFEVTDIGYNDKREINVLEIVNTKKKNQVVYTLGKKKANKSKTENVGKSVEELKNPEEFANEPIEEAKIKAVENMCSKDNVPIDLILTSYKLKDLSEMTQRQFSNAVEKWDKIVEAAKKKAK